MDTASFLRWLGEGRAYRSLRRHERAIAFAQGIAVRHGDRVIPTAGTVNVRRIWDALSEGARWAVLRQGLGLGVAEAYRVHLERRHAGLVHWVGSDWPLTPLGRAVAEYGRTT